jgi:hypothetical protein
MACLGNFHYVVQRAVKLHQGAGREEQSRFIGNVRFRSGSL